MNPANSRFLLNWINSNTTSVDEKVSSITDEGSETLLLKILHLIDKQTAIDLPGTNETFETEQVLPLIISYLGGFHRCNINNVINAESLQKRDELEIGKVITLLLCGATRCDNVAVFVDQITEMDVGDQFTFKFLIESILTELEHGCLTVESFNTILSKTECQKLDPSDSALPSPLTVQSPVEAFFTNSPLKSLVASPQLRSKQNQLMLNKLQQKVSKLQSSLDLQVHVQSELENELTEKNKEIDARDATIIGLRSEIAKLSSSVEELELMRHFKDEFEKTNKENARLKQKVVELQTFRQQCGDLEQKVASFMQEKELFEKEQMETERLNSSIDRYKSKIHHLEFKTSELEATLNRKEQMITKLQKDLAEAVSAASKSAEMRRECERSQTVDVDDVVVEESLSSSEDGSPNHAPLAPVNIDTRIIELELEKRRLMTQLSSAVNQEEYLALKETLEVTEEAQSSYKESYVAAKTRIQELEEQLATEEQKSEQMVEQLKNVQEQCFQEVEQLKTALLNERSLKAELVQELDLREKRLQETAVEIQALATLKTGLEGSLQTSNARTLDEKANYERELSLKTEELEMLGAKLQELEKELLEKTKQVQALEKERDQVRDAYEQMLTDVRMELDVKISSMEEDKAAALAQYRFKSKQLEEDHEKMKKEFANKQKTMLEEAERSASKIQDACDAERFAWKKKFDNLSEEVMSTRSEMFENSKKHAEELIEIRRKAREGEEKLDEEVRKTRDEKAKLENQLLKANSTIAELELEVKQGEAMKKELVVEREKCEELKKKCHSYAANEEMLQANFEQVKKDAESQKERLEGQIKNLEEANRTEVSAVRVALENLKKDYSELEMKRKNEIEKILEDEKQREEELKLQIEEMKTANDEKDKRVEKLEIFLKEATEEKKKKVEELESSLKVSSEERDKRVEHLEAMLKRALEEKESAISDMTSSQIKWQNKQQELESKIEELEGSSEEVNETEFAFVELTNHMEQLQAEKERFQQKAEDEALINRRLGSEIHSLEAQLAHADSQIREQRQEFENRSTMESQRRQTIGGVRTHMYPRQALIVEDSFTDSEDGAPFKLEDLSSSLLSTREARLQRNNPLNQSNRSITSLHSVSGLNIRPGVQTRSTRRQSAIYMRGNTPPERRTTNSAAYFILGDEFKPEMEQDAEVEYDWNRLAELQRRNASCLPHLQTSYPVETQMGPDLTGQEDTLKTGRMSLDTSILKPYNTRKRKSGENVHGSSFSKSKSAPNITPAKQSRSQRITRAMQSALGSLRSRSTENLSKDNQEPGVTSSRRESLAFSIEISPPKKAKKVPIERRRTISRYTATSRLLGDKNKESFKKSKTQNLETSASKERRPLRPRQEKRNAK